MRILVTAAVAAAAILATPASAVNFVKNGNFEQSSFKENHQFGRRFGGTNAVTNWSSASPSGFNLWIDSATATTVGSVTQYGKSGPKDQQLSKNFVALPDQGHLVALDGDPKASGAITQMLTGLNAGSRYVVNFDWAGTQLQNRTGTTTESFLVGFGDQSATTAVVTNVTQGFTGWFNESFTFTAKGSSQLLSFLSVGTPSGLPPVALLDNVSVSAVPEPATWTMMIMGFGLVGVTARRRFGNALKA